MYIFINKIYYSVLLYNFRINIKIFIKYSVIILPLPLLNLERTKIIHSKTTVLLKQKLNNSSKIYLCSKNFSAGYSGMQSKHKKFINQKVE